MSEYLRGDEVSSCVHRIALSRGAPREIALVPASAEMEQRREKSRAHQRDVLASLHALHPDAPRNVNARSTQQLLDEGCDLVLEPALARDEVGRRSAQAHALVRVGKVERTFTYAPLLIRHHEVIEPAKTRRTLEASLAHPRPGEAAFHDGVGPRSSAAMIRSGLALAHATRVLEAMGHGDPLGRVGVVDRQQRLWWFELNGTDYPRFNRRAYDALYAERIEVLAAHERWRAGEGPFPTVAYWHRDCPDCPYRDHCYEELRVRDDVSLVRFSTFDQQLLLREHGVTTRAQLARLSPARAARAKGSGLVTDDHDIEAHLVRSIDKLDDLIYRARAHEWGVSLRRVPVEEMGCPTADVEVDVDMESYDDRTYLWGAYVSSREPLANVREGYVAFAEWGELTPESEAANFARFWRWFDELRAECQRQGRTFAAYCFWAHAEDAAMNRAVVTPVAGGPTVEDLERFRSSTPPLWIDLHELAKSQLQTEGPLGLKQLATAAGFHWRDDNPSGEASMGWYETATRGDDDAAQGERTRLLTYNEDDCRATKALREWLNGPARLLPHRDDDPPAQPRTH